MTMSHVDLKIRVSHVDLVYIKTVEMCENLPTFCRAFESKMSSVRLNFECQMKKCANFVCRNKAFMGPKYESCHGIVAVRRISLPQCVFLNKN